MSFLDARRLCLCSCILSFIISAPISCITPVHGVEMEPCRRNFRRTIQEKRKRKLTEREEKMMAVNFVGDCFPQQRLYKPHSFSNCAQRMNFRVNGLFAIQWLLRKIIDWEEKLGTVLDQNFPRGENLIKFMYHSEYEFRGSQFEQKIPIFYSLVCAPNTRVA